MFDQALINLIKTDAEKDMSALLEQYTGLVYTVVKNKISAVCTSQDIEEVVSDVFVAFYQQIGLVDTDKGKLSAYLITIAKRRAVDKLRRSCLAYDISSYDDGYLEIPDSFCMERDAEKGELYSRLIDEINALGEPDSTIIYHKYYLGESSKQIAEYTGLSSDNVRKRQQRALEKLQSKMKGVYHEN